MYAFQRAISLASGSRLGEHFVPAAEPFRRSFNDGNAEGEAARMIKLPIDSHLFSTPRIPPPAMRDTGATADRKTRTTRAKLLAHRFISPQLSCLHPDFTSLLSSFDVVEIRLSNMPVGCV